MKNIVTIILMFLIPIISLGQEEYLSEELKPIKENFKSINSKTNWTKIKTIKLWESNEGGQATFYIDKKKLRKIIVREFGETYQKITEYYTLDDKLSFVYRKIYKYNRPIGWDEEIRDEMGDDEVFDFDKSEIIEERSYFENELMIRQINNQDCGSPFAKEYLKSETESITKRFYDLIDKIKND